ncbi:MAG: hypothetical protein AB7H97_17815, partial [Pseudobdellovibrionaceae bacterium]
KNIKSVELLDYFEARTLRGIVVNVGDAGESYQRIVEIILERIAVRNPSRAALYRSWYSTFHSETMFLPAFRFDDVPDSRHIGRPEGCEVEQLAVQAEPRFAQDRRYNVSTTLWDHLSEEGKAGLVIHELIYRELIAEGAVDSITVRYLNSLYAADMVKNLNAVAYYELMKSLSFSTIDIAGVRTELSSVEYYEDGSGKTTILCCDLKTELNFKGQKIALVPGSVFEWHPNGTPKRFFPVAAFSTSVNSKQIWIYGEVMVASDGVILDALLTEDASFPIAGRGKIMCSKNAYVDFYENGRLESCSPKGGIEQVVNGDYYKLKINPPAEQLDFRIKFDPNGDYLATYRQGFVDQAGVRRWRRGKNIMTMPSYNKGKILYQESWRSVDAPSYDDQQRLKFAIFKNAETLRSGEREIKLEKGDVGFFSNGKIHFATLGAPQEFLIRGFKFVFQGRGITFFDDPQTEVQSGFLEGVSMFQLQNKVVRFGSVVDTCPKRAFFDKPCFMPTPIQFNADGSIVSGPLAENSELMSTTNQVFEFKKFTLIGFGENEQAFVVK